jgi:hypothetical protein
MRAVKIIAAILLFAVGFFFLVFAIMAFTDKEMGIGFGIFGLIVFGLAVWFGRKLIKSLSGKRNLQAQPQQSKPRPDSDDTIVIEYGDVKGDFSKRTIEIERVYKKNEKLYIDAYCYLADDDRTFLVERILSMKYNGLKIDDIEVFLNDKFMKKKASSSGDYLASLISDAE